MSTDRWRYRTGGLVCVAKLGSEHMAQIARAVPGGCNANRVYGDSPQAIALCSHDRRVEQAYLREHGEAAWRKVLAGRERQLGLEPGSLLRRFEARQAKRRRTA